MMIGLCKKLKPFGGGIGLETPWIVRLLGEDYKAELRDQISVIYTIVEWVKASTKGE